MDGIEEKEFAVMAIHAPRTKLLPPAQLDDSKDMLSSDESDDEHDMYLQSREDLLLEEEEESKQRKMTEFKDRLGLTISVDEDDDKGSIEFASPPSRFIRSPPLVTPSPASPPRPAPVIAPAVAPQVMDYYQILESVFKELHATRSQLEVVTKERDGFREDSKALSAKIELLEKNLQDKACSINQQIRVAIQEEVQNSIAPLFAQQQKPQFDMSALESYLDSLRSEASANVGEMRQRLDVMDSRFESLVQLSSMVHSKMADLEMLFVQTHVASPAVTPPPHAASVNQLQYPDDDWEIVTNYSSSPSRLGEQHRLFAFPRSSRRKGKLGEYFERLQDAITPGKVLLGSVPDIENSHAELLDELESLGYKSRGLNAMLLKVHNYDIELVKKELSTLQFR